MAITLADFNKIWASSSPLTPYSFTENNYKQGWNFIGSTPPARQMWDYLQKNNDEKMQYLANNYLPLSGGTMSGVINFSNNNAVLRNVYSDNSGQFGIQSTSDTSKGAYITLHGENYSDSGLSGQFRINAANTTSGRKTLAGTPGGGLTWNGQPIQTSSDKRIKRDFSDVPAEILEAWGKVNWQQFKYIDDAERKGVNNCRWHTGLVAQDVKEVGEENNVDLLKYGILCHDIREAVEEEKDEDGNIIQEASEAVDLWTIRYEEALAMEAAYQRRRADRLEERIEALEKLLMNRTE